MDSTFEVAPIFPRTIWLHVKIKAGIQVGIYSNKGYTLRSLVNIYFVNTIRRAIVT